MKRVLEKIGCLFLVLFLFLPLVVNANIMCNDGTRSPSCQDCHQGCCSHHGGCAYGGSDSSSSNSNSYSNSNYVYQQPIVQEPLKSSDTSLKSVTVDGEELSLSDTLSYQTQKDNVMISALPNDSKSTVDYNSSTELKVGENIINIKVTAEDGSSKEYQLNITREKILSNNKNIKIMVDGKEIEFSSFQSKTIHLSNNEDKLDLEYELEDPYAQAEVIGNSNLKVGKNKVIVKVTAENGEIQEYTLLVEKEEYKITASDVIVSLLFLSGGGSIIYYGVKKKKSK